MLFGNRFSMAVHIVIGTQKFMRKSGGHFVFWQSARGLAHSKTLRVFQASSCRAKRLGLRRPSAAFPRGVSNCAHVNWNRYMTMSSKRPDRYARWLPYLALAGTCWLAGATIAEAAEPQPASAILQDLRSFREMGRVLY